MGLIISSLPPPVTFNFDSLPYNIQVKLFEEFTYAQFTCFEQCSTSTASFSTLHKHMKFPISMYQMTIKDKEIKVWHNRGSSSLGDITQTRPSAFIETEILLTEGSIDNEISKFILERVKGITRLQFARPRTFPWNFFLSLSNQSWFKPRSIYIDAEFVNNDFPHDHSNIDMVYIDNCSHLRPTDIFSIRAKELAIVKKASLSDDQLMDQFERWIEGELSFDHKFVVELSAEQFPIWQFVAQMNRFNHTWSNLWLYLQRLWPLPPIVSLVASLFCELQLDWTIRTKASFKMLYVSLHYSYGEDVIIITVEECAWGQEIKPRMFKSL